MTLAANIQTTILEELYGLDFQELSFEEQKDTLERVFLNYTVKKYHINGNNINEMMNKLNSILTDTEVADAYVFQTVKVTEREQVLDGYTFALLAVLQTYYGISLTWYSDEPSNRVIPQEHYFGTKKEEIPLNKFMCLYNFYQNNLSPTLQDTSSYFPILTKEKMI